MVCVAVACGGGDGGGKATATSAGAGPTAAGGAPTAAANQPTEDNGVLPDEHTSLQVGSSAEVQSSNHDPNHVDDPMGTLKATIIAITDPAQGSGYTGDPQAGNRFWAVEVKVEATGDTAVNTGIWTLHTTDGQEYEARMVTGVGEDLFEFAPLDPGETKQGVVVFDIPQDAAVQWLFMDPSIYLGG
jgi:hypothetical protein